MVFIAILYTYMVGIAVQTRLATPVAEHIILELVYSDAKNALP